MSKSSTDESLFVGDACVNSNVSVSDISVESDDEKKDANAISRMLGPGTAIIGKQTQKNEENRYGKVSMIYDLLGRPGPTKWNGKRGKIQDICDVLKLSPRKNYDKSIQNVLKNCNVLQKDKVCNPTHKEHVHTKEILSKEQKPYLADTMEKQYASICDATKDIHDTRAEKGQNT
eukprot:12047361-Ditylum_brightwellii.AAC.1